MKKALKTTLVLALSLFIFQISVTAQTFTIDKGDFSIDIDDENWYVFTLDNIDGNKELDELSMDPELLKQLFEEGGLSMNAVLFGDDFDTTLELFVRILPDSEIHNISTYYDANVKKFAKITADKAHADKYDIYKNDYKWAYLEYKDDSTGTLFYVVQYITIMNGKGYNIHIQKTTEITDEDKELFRQMIDTVVLVEDKELAAKAAERDGIYSKEDGLDYKELAIRVGSGLVLAAIVVITILVIVKKKKKGNVAPAPAKEVTEAPKPTVAEEIKAEIEEKAEGTKKCECGYKLTEGDKECPMCGKKV